MNSDRHSKNFIILMGMITLLSVIIAITDENEVPDISQFQEKAAAQDVSPMATDVKDGIHIPTGLIADTHLELVISNCTACHSSNLIIQNRQTAQGWKNIIDWMQEKQNLWDLGADEKKIIAYLAKNYAPKAQGRRKQLAIKSDDWYVLEN